MEERCDHSSQHTTDRETRGQVADECAHDDAEAGADHSHQKREYQIRRWSENSRVGSSTSYRDDVSIHPADYRSRQEQSP